MKKVKITKKGVDWCEPCKSMKKELKKLKKAHPKWDIKDIDISKDPKKHKNLNAIPVTEICVDNKCKEIEGGITKEQIEREVDRI